MEIYRGSTQNVYLDLFGESADSTPTATATRGDGTIVSLSVTSVTPPDGVDTRYVATLGLASTASEDVLKVIWSLSIDGNPLTKTDYYEVVTPYLSITEVKKIFTQATDQEAMDVESAVRHVINAHTGQQFGYSVKTLVVEGHGETALRLPERLIELTGISTVSANLDPNNSIITSDGWYLKKGWTGAVTPIESDSTYWNGDDFNADFQPFDGSKGYEKPNHGPIIQAPNVGSAPTKWRDDYPFTLTGRWGYEYVPTDVKEAAKLLVNDYACSEALYRDRYLESIKAADWRLQFSSRAWEYTGNVRADQLLSKYVLLDWAVV